MSAAHDHSTVPPTLLWYGLLLAVAVGAWSATFNRVEADDLLVTLYDHLAGIILAALGVPAAVGVGKASLGKLGDLVRKRQPPGGPL